jgi:hypothetical protein
METRSGGRPCPVYRDGLMSPIWTGRGLAWRPVPGRSPGRGGQRDGGSMSGLSVGPRPAAGPAPAGEDRRPARKPKYVRCDVNGGTPGSGRRRYDRRNRRGRADLGVRSPRFPGSSPRSCASMPREGPWPSPGSLGARRTTSRTSRGAGPTPGLSGRQASAAPSGPVGGDCVDAGAAPPAA